MKPATLLGLAVLAVPCVVAAQTTKSSLEALYGEPVKGVFIVNSGVKLKALYGSHHRACLLTISGPISEKDLMKAFEAAVPAKTRGVKKQDMEECAGACERIREFENVDFTWGVIGTRQVSEPDAIIIFKREDCEAAAKSAKQIGFSVKLTGS